MDESTKFKRLRKKRNQLVGLHIAGIIACSFFGIYIAADPNGKIFNVNLFYQYIRLFLSTFFVPEDLDNVIKLISLVFAGIGVLSGASIMFLLIRRYVEFGGYFFSIISGLIYIIVGVLFFFVFPATLVPILFILLGVAIIFLGIYGIHIKRLSLFFFNTSIYTIADVSDSLVVYFSDRGPSKKIAFEIAARNGSEVYELVPIAFSSKSINQDSFYKKYSRKNHGMSFDTQNMKNFETYKKMLVISPMSWRKLSPAVRYFFREFGRKISPNLEVYLVGNGGGSRRNLGKISNEIMALTELPDFKLFKINIILGNKTKPKLFKKM